MDKDTAISKIYEVSKLCPELTLKNISFIFQPKKEIEEVKTKDTKKGEKELKTAKKQ